MNSGGRSTAYARDSELARKAALVFVGEMLDVLALDFGLPLRLSVYDFEKY
jgi:hypothetical protein